MLYKSLILLFLLISVSSNQAQVYESKWGLGFGGVYPRFFSISGTAVSGNENYGAFISIERYFNESLSLRLLTNYVHIQSEYTQDGARKFQNVDHLSGNLDIIYKIIPCRAISPFIIFGLGGTAFRSQNSFNAELDDELFGGYQTNFGIGVEWGLSSSLSLKTEAVYRTSSNNKIDGNERINENDKGVFGGNGDTYATFDIGLIWYISKGDESDFCDKCPEGIREIVNIDTIIIKEPYEVYKEIIDTVIIEQPILFGIHFEFDKYDLLPESYPILDHAVEVLKQFPGIVVNIGGHTDSFGTDDYNIKLSEKRVNTVYNYLIANGIKPERVNKNWFGEDKPIRENDSPFNRAFNRRVEINIIE